MKCRRFPMFSFLFLFFLYGGWFYALTFANHDSCRRLKFLEVRDGYALVGHAVKNFSLQVGMHMHSHCKNWCSMEDRCKSINMGPSGEKKKVLCQLSDSDDLQHPNDLKPMAGFIYRSTENKCCFSICYNNATCLVGFTNKGYKCVCPPGYTGEHCEKDVDECTTKTHKFDVNAECNNTEGSFNCSCKVGFDGDGKSCKDVDECATNTHKCGVNFRCINTEGSFHCSCEDGFDGDDENCTDIDECLTNIHKCDVNAECNNTEGSFNCSCKVGFNGDGRICTDIDECSVGVHGCLNETATCINTIGSYNCSYNHGYVGDGSTSYSVQSPECQNTSSFKDAERKETYSGSFSVCDTSLGPNWFRFQGAAGNKMATTCVPTDRCGTQATGWLNGSHPTVSEGIVTRQVCFHWSSRCCEWSINIQVRNCNGYFVYNISGTPPEHPCHLRYCGAD